MASGMKIVKMGAGRMTFCSDCDREGLCDLRDSCSQKSCGQARMVVWYPLFSAMRKPRVKAWRARQSGHVWRQCQTGKRMTVRSFKKKKTSVCN